MKLIKISNILLVKRFYIVNEINVNKIFFC